MHEFNNRVQAQRRVLQIVNGHGRQNEELCGLSGKAIDRWVAQNRIEPEGRLVSLLRLVADELFFLANKSQEQITEEYGLRSRRVGLLANEIEAEMNRADSQPAYP